MAILSSFASGAAGQHAPYLPIEPGHVVQTAVHPFWSEGERTQVERLPLLEVFTATWCPPCAPADRAIDRLLHERSPGLSPGDNDSADAAPIGLAVLSYHPWPDIGMEDPFGLPEGQERMTAKYDAFWFPSVYVDGFLEDAPETRSREVDAGMEGLLYQSYAGLLEQAAAVPAGFTARTAWSEDEGNLTVHLTLEATARLEHAVVVRGVLWEDDVRFRGSNGIDTHRMTVRALTEPHAPPPLAPGAEWSTTWTLVVPAGVDLGQAGMTFIIETAWQDPGADPSVLMSFGAGVAAVAAGAVFVLRRRTVRQRRTPPEDPARSAPPDDREVIA